MATASMTALGSVFLCVVAQAPPDGPEISIDHLDLAREFTWGYRCGVKQPLGSYFDGRTVHQISRSNWPEGVEGNPDFLIWVDETTGEHGIVEHPTNQLETDVVNPGGQAAFDRDGYIWFVNGGRAADMPFDLYRSSQPLDPTSFQVVLDDFVVEGASTTPCLTIDDENVMLYWRYLGSSLGNRVRARAWRIDASLDFDEEDINVGAGINSFEAGKIGIEQLWPRFDPRYGVHLYTWQWFKVYEHRFGSNPVVYSEDAGETWHRVDGSPVLDLPVNYDERDEILVPQDDIALGQDVGWHVRDLGVGPGGTYWITLPEGDVDADGWVLRFHRFVDGAWSAQPLTRGLLRESKPHALGATRDYLVLLYAEVEQVSNTILARISDDDGATWSDPIAVLTLRDDENGQPTAVSWISFVQPAFGYDDNAARFVYSYFRRADGPKGKNYQNRVAWVRVDIENPACPGDYNGDGVNNVLDFIAFVLLWQGHEPLGDCDGNGVYDILDFVCFQQLFVEGCD